MKKRKKKTKTLPEKPELNYTSGNPHVKIIEEYLRTLRFRKYLFRGVLEKDVWKAIAKLNELYDNALVCERKTESMEKIKNDGTAVL